MDEGYKLLAASIVNQAIKDYQSARKTLHIYGHRQDKSEKVRKALLMVEDVEKFFSSEWYHMLCPNIDGKKLYEQIKKNYDEYGKCKPFSTEIGEFEEIA